MAVGRNMLLRTVRQLPVPAGVLPTVLGVDDFALRKRQTYGTVLIDLERRQPVALLPDREAATLGEWLRAHPQVAVVTRDRSKAYERGIRHGAPAAIQVADRFHLLQNLAEALEQVFSSHSTALKAVNDAMRQVPVSQQDGIPVAPVPWPLVPYLVQAKAARRRARRVALYEQIWTLRRQGASGQAIARQLGIGRCTVFRYLRVSGFPERKARSDRGRSVLTPYKAYLLQRWNDGCHEALRLFEELKSHGYSGSLCHGGALRRATSIASRCSSARCLAGRISICCTGALSWRKDDISAEAPCNSTIKAAIAFLRRREAPYASGRIVAVAHER